MKHDFIASIEQNKLIKDPKISVVQNGFGDPRHPKGANPEETTGTREQQALKLCVSVYNDYLESDIKYMSDNLRSIWKIGKEESNETKPT